MKKFVAAFLIALSALSAGSSKAQVVVAVRPEFPVAGVRPVCPHPGWVWIDGEWFWHRRFHRYVWREGHWIRPRPRQVWIGGHWVDAPGGSVWVPGHWARRF